MITVPSKYNQSVNLLLATRTGKALIHNPRLNNVTVRVSATLLAHGQSLDANTIEISNNNYSIPQMACILAHELTHCHDFAYFNGTTQEYKAKGIGLTEVSAHFNQGKILREFNDIKHRLPVGLEAYADNIESAVNGSTVFGKSVLWRTRASVVTYLMGTPHYGDVLRRPANAGVGLWHEDMWTSAKIPFHCDENWDIYTSDDSVNWRAEQHENRRAVQNELNARFHGGR